MDCSRGTGPAAPLAGTWIAACGCRRRRQAQRTADCRVPQSAAPPDPLERLRQRQRQQRRNDRAGCQHPKGLEQRSERGRDRCRKVHRLRWGAAASGAAAGRQPRTAARVRSMRRRPPPAGRPCGTWLCLEDPPQAVSIARCHACAVTGRGRAQGAWSPDHATDSLEWQLKSKVAMLSTGYVIVRGPALAVLSWPSRRSRSSAPSPACGRLRASCLPGGFLAAQFCSFGVLEPRQRCCARRQRPNVL